MLVIGVALGSVAFPMNRTETTKQLTTMRTTQTLVSVVGQTVTNTRTETVFSSTLTQLLTSMISTTTLTTSVANITKGMVTISGTVSSFYFPLFVGFCAGSINESVTTTILPCSQSNLFEAQVEVTSLTMLTFTNTNQTTLYTSLRTAVWHLLYLAIQQP